jgi:hypothetical protein
LKQFLNPIPNAVVHSDSGARVVCFDVVEYLFPVGDREQRPFKFHGS